ncbi:nucleoside kinase [Mangrovibacterium diazotrophicum]|uniref:Uridine kinase n=1 Tax=Mangrovibacterium diazotrophicum TaxID=1261403 RepID=A0A419VV60_9BACT|nr:nucleoside kinase [Mangrovibacterium diazotrophicum]RKD86025.1 uridine kinase [Mangrovibacterium diazotrophicum]
MSARTIDIYCENNNTVQAYPLGTTLEEVKDDLGIQLDNPICGALVNNKVKELSFSVVKSKKVEFIDYTHIDGRRLYVRSLIFLLYVAVREVFPQVKLKVLNGISNGYYCELIGLKRKITDSDIWELKSEMQSWVEKDLPFEKKGILTPDAVEELVRQGLEEKAKLFDQQGMMFSFLYFLNGYCNYFYGHHVPSTGYLTTFDIVPYFDGILLQVPKPDNFKEVNEVELQEKLFGIFKEHKKRAELMNVPNLGMLNEYVESGRGGDIIKISEALHEKKVAEIANMIDERKDHVKVVLVAGPSASGKTTFSKRLAVQMAVNGITPHLISLDDYFVDREQTPRDEHGNYDFESLDAIDVDFFNLQLLQLFGGEEVELPRFNFILGRREFTGEKLKLGEGHILIVEGIHGMNPGLMPHVQNGRSFKIFLSALTQISLDDHNHISTTDNRLIRRMIRDSKYRGYSAADTIKRWPSVRSGEEKNIFPYQENADVMFNSALIYELAVLKKYVEPLLKAVPEVCEEHCEANRLLKFFSYFHHIDDAEIPPTSLIREFLGGSSFKY